MKFSLFIIFILVILNVMTESYAKNKRRVHNKSRTPECVAFCSKGGHGKCTNKHNGVACYQMCMHKTDQYCLV